MNQFKSHKISAELTDWTQTTTLYLEKVSTVVRYQLYPWEEVKV